MCGPAAPPFTFPLPLPPAQDTLGPDDGSGLYFLPGEAASSTPPQQNVVPPPSNVTLPLAYKCCTSPRSRGRVPRTSLYLTLCGRLAPRRGAQRLRRSCRGLHQRLPLRLLSSLGPLLVIKPVHHAKCTRGKVLPLPRKRGGWGGEVAWPTNVGCGCAPSVEEEKNYSSQAAGPRAPRLQAHS